ncbi:MAG: 23S rRNA (pseudouridine(1915)-N(3))-methyltransferase RlmH [Betaproteobacteria bacterium]|nr:23S rRNA (pseudouridine(1915)-N(3))-methyltransferase RlmH [Betaproteobacteria bacterium]MDE2622074.1 23S rRNA (pseudouridine(1915)-N(3))-methyltransferase RlmH [Betaproteobacteria bacterium]
MKIRIITLGHRMPRWVSEASQEYLQRMPREMPVILTELKPEPRHSGRSTEQILELESQRILAAIPGGSICYALDERGSLWSTRDLAATLNQAPAKADEICFVIGSADGLHAKVKQRANELVALSRMTLPHGLVRVLLAEQLYRACAILKGHPYHRE